MEIIIILCRDLLEELSIKQLADRKCSKVLVPLSF